MDLTSARDDSYEPYGAMIEGPLGRRLARVVISSAARNLQCGVCST